MSVHSPMGPWPCDGEAPWPFQPGCWACPAEGSGGGRLLCVGLLETSSQVECPESTCLHDQNKHHEPGSPDPRHLHNQQFQPSRADSSRGKGGCACWGASCPGHMLASGPTARPRPHGLWPLPSDCAFIPALSAPPPSSLRSHSELSRSLRKHPPQHRGCRRGKARRAPRCLLDSNARPSLARSQTASPEGATLKLEKAQLGLPLPGLQSFPQVAKKVRPASGKGTRWWLRAGSRALEGRESPGQKEVDAAFSKSGEKSREGDHGGWGGVTSRRGHGRRRGGPNL